MRIADTEAQNSCPSDYLLECGLSGFPREGPDNRVLRVTELSWRCDPNFPPQCAKIGVWSCRRRSVDEPTQFLSCSFLV